MNARIGRFAALVLLAFTAAASAQDSRTHNEGQRDEWQKVQDIFAAMLVKPGAVVADVGAGDGYFTSRLAAAVGPQGRVLAVDVGASALRRLRQRVDEERLTNVEVIEGSAADPKLPSAAVDAILIVNAYHEMTQYPAMLARMKAALKPGGRLVIVEPISEARRAGSRADQTRNHEIAIDFVKQDAREAGFAQVLMQDPFTTRKHAHGGHEDQEWMLVLAPPAAAAASESAWSASKHENWQAPELRISIADFKALAAVKEVLVLDVRDMQMYRDGHLPGSTLLTVEDLSKPETLARLRAEQRPIVAYCSCESEQSSARVAIILKKAGVENVLALVGGYEEWLRRGETVVKGDASR
jgi:predicted methyltransferase/rhodanese-related sulfurtransferase